jgi:hypothetical protein
VDLFDEELDVALLPFVVQDANIFQAHQGLDDISRIGGDEGASCFLTHNLKPEVPSFSSGPFPTG